MHTLYLQYLECKGRWASSQLVLSVKKTNGSDYEEVFKYKTKKQLYDELGQQLADDLVQRHKAAEAADPKKRGHFIKRTLGVKGPLITKNI